jgi:predicted ATP-dependent serine protease
MKIVKLKDLKIPQEVLVPLKTNTILDDFISHRGGLLPSCVYVVVGGAGSGKTSWSIDTMHKLQTNNPQKRILYISGEQDVVDNYELSQKIPGLLDLNTLYLAGCTEPQKTLTTVLNEGWDVVLLDSLEVIAGRINATSDLNVKQSTRWVLDLMFKHKKGGNKQNIYTSFVVIQQSTKSGKFKGDSSIEFDTTGMLYVKFDEEVGERYLTFSKNRRGDNKIRQYYTLSKGSMVYTPEVSEIDSYEEIKEEEESTYKTMFKHSFF